MFCPCHTKLYMQLWLPHNHRDFFHHASIQSDCLLVPLLSCWCASRWHPPAEVSYYQGISTNLNWKPFVNSHCCITLHCWIDVACKDLLYVVWSTQHICLIWPPNHLRHCIFDVLFPSWTHFLTTAASSYLHQSPTEAFGFYSMLCCLSLPLLSATLCPLWLLLLYMMNVTCFGLFS